MLRTLDLTQPLADFARDGYARLGKLCNDQTLAGLRARADEIMLGQVVYPGLFFQIDSPSGSYEDLIYRAGWQGPSLAYRKIEKLEADDRFRSWLKNPAFEEVAHALIGPGAIALYRAVLFCKEGERGGTVLPWHQDGGLFWGVDRAPTLQIWTALDDCPVEAGCVEAIPGSHKNGLATVQGGTLPPELLQRSDAERRAVQLPTHAGEVLLIHNHVWHRSRKNHSGRTRRAFSVCLMPEATRCLRRKREPRRFFQVFGQSE